MTTVVTIQCGSGDCWTNKNNTFSSTGNNLYIVDDPSATNSNVRTWIPFVIPFGYVVIEQAYITVQADQVSAVGSGNIKISCEAADNPSTPVSGADLNARTLSSYSSTIAISGWSLNQVLTWQIDNPIQETLARPGWSAGNTLAVIIDDVDLGDILHSVYSYEGNATYRAYLTLNITNYVPKIAVCV